MPNMFGGDQFDEQYAPAARLSPASRELSRADPIAWGSHMPAAGVGQPDAVLSNGNFLDHKVAADLEQSRRANFQREWPLIPRELQRRIKELARISRSYRQRDFIYLQGVLQGYGMADNKFDSVYAILLVQEISEHKAWIIDEVQNASVSK